MEKDTPTEGILYVCVHCKSKITDTELELTPEIKCPFCGYRVLRKIRPSIVKRVKTA
jgi:DNA-directed RNA polymerase subunit P